MHAPAGIWQLAFASRDAEQKLAQSGKLLARRMARGLRDNTRCESPLHSDLTTLRSHCSLMPCSVSENPRRAQHLKTTTHHVFLQTTQHLQTTHGRVHLRIPIRDRSCCPPPPPNSLPQPSNDHVGPTAKPNYNWFPLHLACMSSCAVVAVKRLLETYPEAAKKADTLVRVSLFPDQSHLRRPMLPVAPCPSPRLLVGLVSRSSFRLKHPECCVSSALSRSLSRSPPLDAHQSAVQCSSVSPLPFPSGQQFAVAPRHHERDR